VNPNIRWLGAGAGVRALGMSLIAPFLVLYLRNVLGLPYVEIGAIVVVVAITPLIVAPFSGLLTDRIGRRRLIRLALAFEAASMLLTAVGLSENNVSAVVAAFAAVSTMGALAGPAISAYVADFASGSDRTMGFTWVRVGWNAGFTIGVFLGGGLIGAIGFVNVTLAAGIVLAAGALFIGLGLDPSPYDLERRRRTPAAETPPPPGPGSVRQSLRILSKDRPFLVLCVAGALATLTVSQWSTTFPLFVNTILGVPYLILGIGLAINGLIVVFGQTFTTQLSLGHRHTDLMILGTILYVVAYLLLGTFGLVGFVVVTAFFVTVVILTIGENLISIPTTTLPSNLAPTTEVGSYNGAFAALTGTGSVFASLFGGFVLSITGNALLIWIILVIPAVPAILLTRWVAGRLPPIANRA
jgi:MFS family permease